MTHAGAGRESAADGNLVQTESRQLQALAGTDQLMQTANGNGGRRRLQKKKVHHHTPSYRKRLLKPHAHTPTYYAKQKSAGKPTSARGSEEHTDACNCRATHARACASVLQLAALLPIHRGL